MRCHSMTAEQSRFLINCMLEHGVSVCGHSLSQVAAGLCCVADIGADGRRPDGPGAMDHYAFAAV